MTGTHRHPNGWRPRRPISLSPTSETDLSREHSFSRKECGGKGGDWRVVNNRCETTCTSRRHPLLENAATRRRWGRGENTASCPADNLQSHRLGQASQQPGHRTRQRMADCEVWTEVRGSSLIISNTSKRSLLTATSAHVPMSRIDNRDMRTRTRIRFDYRLTCLLVTNIVATAITLMPASTLVHTGMRAATASWLPDIR